MFLASIHFPIPVRGQRRLKVKDHTLFPDHIFRIPFSGLASLIEAESIVLSHTRGGCTRSDVVMYYRKFHFYLP